MITALFRSRLLALVALGMLVHSGPAFAQTDYDTDNDNYIEVSGHAQLNAIRYDLNGDGVIAATDTANYNAAFPNAATGMGCAATCVGYELTANINLTTYTNWNPLGSATTEFTGDFKGNGHTIDNLTINRSSTTNVGLFGRTSSAARIESVGITNANVTGNSHAGALVGALQGEVVACWSTGSVTATRVVGGLVGWSNNSNAITTSYSHASVTGTAAQADHVGGLMGQSQSATIRNSYSTGRVTRTGNHVNVGGLLGSGGAYDAPGCYWNTTTSGWSLSAGSQTAVGRTTSQLRSPTTYGATSSDTYYGWNIDLDNADGDSDRTTGKDDPWDFAGSSAYPTLIYHLTDYDTDEDGYIEISGHAQLNAVRYDLNGDGVVAATDTANYNAAFPNRVTSSTKRMGCPSGTCVGYELTANVDLDTNGDGNHTAADAYYNSGNGWDPLGDDSGNQYSGNFKGNGFTIDNLVINRTGTDDVGLFGANSSASTIETLGVINANVTAREYVGILVGTSYGPIVACYTTGAVSGSRSDVGGLVGLMNASNASVSSSYSTASVGGAANNAGGLIGRAISSNITNSYSTGRVNASGNNIGGLIGLVSSATVTASYWDTTTSGRSNSAAGTGYATAALQTPTGYTGIYSTWNANIDGQTGNDDPWYFGNSRQYPSLKYGGHDLSKQSAGDYDSDNDRLIEVSNLAQLNAMRYDRYGRGTPTSGGATTYNAAFLYRDTRSGSRMGCPSGTCTGYELIADLDFDSDGDGDVDANDHGGAYWNGGAGWTPIGGVGSTAAWRTTFRGNGHTINNLFINRPGVANQAMFVHLWSEGRIESLGVTNADITGGNRTSILVRNNNGNIIGCYVTGKVTGGNYVGGLVAFLERIIRSSYSHASVTGASRVGGLVGHVQHAGPRIYNSYSTGRVTGTSNVGGLVGYLHGSATLNNTVNSHWDTQTSGQPTSRGGTGKTTRELLSPTTYGATTSDTYYNWNNAGQGGAGADPWTFGTMLQYPALKFASMDTTVQFQRQPVIVTATLTPSTISENGEMSTVTATLTRSRTEATTITVRPVTGAYTVGADSTITIASGQTANASDTVVITAVDNTLDEADRNVDLSAQGQGIAVLSPVITITDDDAPPRLSISSPSAVEGTALTFTVRLNAVSGKAVTVAYADAGTGTATSGTDYTALTAGTLTFAAGTTTTSQTIAVSVSDDGDDEPNETVIVTLSSATNATISTAQGTGTIIDDDGMPALSIGSPSVIEGATSATLTFQVYLRPAHTAQVTVAYADAGTGTATSGTDYTALTAGTLTFAATDTIQTIPVSVTDDSDDEPNETVIVELSSATNATISTAQGTGTIIDDETPSANLDVDGDGRVRLFSDIILVIRYVLFFREEALLRGNVIEPTATRTTAQAIEPYLDTLVNQNILDVDGDGDVRLFSDIILIIRYVLFFRNEALLRGNVIEQNATRTTAQAIEPYIRSLYPASHFQ